MIEMTLPFCMCVLCATTICKHQAANACLLSNIINVATKCSMKFEKPKLQVSMKNFKNEKTNEEQIRYKSSRRGGEYDACRSTLINLYFHSINQWKWISSTVEASGEDCFVCLLANWFELLSGYPAALALRYYVLIVAVCALTTQLHSHLCSMCQHCSLTTLIISAETSLKDMLVLQLYPLMNQNIGRGDMDFCTKCNVDPQVVKPCH